LYAGNSFFVRLHTHCNDYRWRDKQGFITERFILGFIHTNLNFAAVRFVKYSLFLHWFRFRFGESRWRRQCRFLARSAYGFSSNWSANRGMSLRWRRFLDFRRTLQLFLFFFFLLFFFCLSNAACFCFLSLYALLPFLSSCFDCLAVSFLTHYTYFSWRILILLFPIWNHTLLSFWSLLRFLRWNLAKSSIQSISQKVSFLFSFYSIVTCGNIVGNIAFGVIESSYKTYFPWFSTPSRPFKFFIDSTEFIDRALRFFNYLAEALLIFPWLYS